MREPDRIAWRFLVPRERLELLDYALAAAHMEYDEGFEEDNVAKLIEVAMRVLEYCDAVVARGMELIGAAKKRTGSQAPLQRILDEILIEVG